jgi:hypothetical protein
MRTGPVVRNTIMLLLGPCMQHGQVNVDRRQPNLFCELEPIFIGTVRPESGLPKNRTVYIYPIKR